MPSELCTQVALTPYARDEFKLARSGEINLDPVERARRFLVAAMMTVNGTSGSVNNSGFSVSDSYVRGGKEARVNRWYQLPDRLESVVERLRSIRIENKDARRVIKQYADRPATLMYLDPPYLMDREHVYAMDANEEQFHNEILQACNESQAMLIISGYTCPLYTKHLNAKNGWTLSTIATTTRGTNGLDVTRTEALWTNLAFKNAKASGKIPVELSDVESKQKKLNPKRLNSREV
jgi:DNA adenine methylase